MRRITISFMALGLMAAPMTAAAQGDNVTVVTSFDPVATVIDGYAAGDGVSGFVQTNTDAGAPIASSLQFLVNLSWGPVFLDTDAIPHGLTGSGAELESLNEWFDGNLTSLPPLHPWGTINGAADIAGLFPDWTAYGEDGPIEGPVQIIEPPTVVWAMELADPFDETCSDNRSVGRAWQKAAITGPEGVLTPELLEQDFAGDSHTALANGENTRFIELHCSEGGSPRVLARRVNPDLGRIRPFGPTDVVALVNGSHVVFFMTERILGIDDVPIDPFFYANEPGGAVAPFEPVADVPALVPNVYDTYSTRITITMDIPEDEEARHQGESQGEHLLFRPGDAQIVTTGTDGCLPPTGAEYAADFADDLLDGLARAGLWSIDASWALRFAEGSDYGEWRGTSPEGQEFTVRIDDDGNVTVQTDECEGTGTASGEPFGTDPGPDEREVVAGDDGTDADVNVEPVFSDESGAPWGLIGVAAVLLAGVGIVVGRSRTRTKDCKPEQEAWEAAIEAFDEAKRTREYWQGERDHWNRLYGEQRSAIDNRLDEPNRELGFPNTPEGQASYERALDDWQDREAAARDAMEVVDAFREKAETAERNLEESQAALDTAADLVWQAQIALQNCQGSAPPLPAGIDTGTGESDPAPTEPPPIESDTGCTEGATRWVTDDTKSPKSFVIPESVQLRLPTSGWAGFAPGGVADPTALNQLTEEEALALVRDLDNQRVSTVRPTATIVLSSVTVTCEKQQQCVAAEQWEDTGATRAAETRAPAGTDQADAATRLDSEGLAGFISGDLPSLGAATETGEAAERGKLKAALAPYMKALQEYQDFTCD